MASLLTAPTGCQKQGPKINNDSIASTTQPSEPLLLFPESELAGSYYLGDGLGVNCRLKLNSDHHFSFHWHGCLGEYNRHEGRWEMQADNLILHPRKSRKADKYFPMNDQFIPVKWDKRVYLIRECRMPGFCAAARDPDAEYLKDIHGKDYVKVAGDDFSSPKSTPVIPERFKHFYEVGPIEVKVVAVDESGNAILDKGSIDRIQPGLRFVRIEPYPFELEVLSTEKNKSIARPHFWGKVRIDILGAKLTTGDFYRRPWGL